MSRKLYNTAIVEKLRELVNKYPDMRFGQLLVNCDIIQLRFSKEYGEPLGAKDPFNEESKVIWERMKNNKFAFKELWN